MQCENENEMGVIKKKSTGFCSNNFTSKEWYDSHQYQLSSATSMMSKERVSYAIAEKLKIIKM